MISQTKTKMTFVLHADVNLIDDTSKDYFKLDLPDFNKLVLKEKMYLHLIKSPVKIKPSREVMFASNLPIKK